MNRDSVLIVERDPNARAQLVQILASVGYDVYGAGANKLASAVNQTPFPVVLIDISGPDLEVAQMVYAVRKRRADAAVILTGTTPQLERLVEGIRAGATDFISKPFSPHEVRDRVFTALEKRRADQVRRQPRQDGNNPAPGQQTNAEVLGLLHRFRAFHDQVLEVFLDLEQRNVELDNQLNQLKRQAGTGSGDRPLSVMLAHSDPSAQLVIETTLRGTNAHVLPQAFTGGELLDRVSSAPVDIVLVAGDLPDIPGQMVASGLASESAFITVLTIDGWGTDEIRVERANSDVPPSLATTRTFPEVLRNFVGQHRDREEAHSLAQSFRARHEPFIRSTAEVRKLIDDAIGSGPA